MPLVVHQIYGAYRHSPGFWGNYMGLSPPITMFLQAKQLLPNPVFNQFQGFNGKSGLLMRAAPFPRQTKHPSPLPNSQKDVCTTTNNTRLRSSWLTPAGVILGLIITSNVVVFLLWQVGDEEFMRHNFTVSLENLRCWRLYTMITSGFSQRSIGDLVLNMIAVHCFGSIIGILYGPEFLLALYLSGAFVGSSFFLIHQSYRALPSKGGMNWKILVSTSFKNSKIQRAYEEQAKKRNPSEESKQMLDIDHSKVSGLASSGAVYAVMLLPIFLFPKSKICVQFVPPLPTFLVGAFFFGRDMLRILQVQEYGKDSGVTPLGGIVVSAIVWMKIITRRL